ncbi:MAG: phytanoyl-CoA dioxygenase family protein [Planctomycetota bacterium]
MPIEQRELAVRKLFGFKDTVPDLIAAANHPRLLCICEKLMGESVRLVQEMALLKPPGGGVEKPWHQDAAYFRLATPTGVIGTWTALDAAYPDNGCMHVIPGSHHAGPRPHYHDRDCQLPDDTIDRDHIVAVPLEPGGTMFFSGLLHHGTPPNASADRRRALQFHYLTASGVESEDPAILASLFGDRAGFAGCQGWAWGEKPRPLHLRKDF